MSVNNTPASVMLNGVSIQIDAGHNTITFSPPTGFLWDGGYSAIGYPMDRPDMAIGVNKVMAKPLLKMK